MRKLKIIRYDSLSKCFNAAFGAGSPNKRVRYTQIDGKGHRIERRKFLDNVRRLGCWGWSMRETNEMHLWIDHTRAKPIEIYGLIAHELGHLSRPHYRSDSKEEIKAGQYEHVAIQAFNIAKDMKRKRGACHE